MLKINFKQQQTGSFFSDLIFYEKHRQLAREMSQRSLESLVKYMKLLMMSCVVQRILLSGSFDGLTGTC